MSIFYKPLPQFTFLYLSTGDDLRLGELEAIVAGVSELCGEGVPGAEGIVIFTMYSIYNEVAVSIPSSQSCDTV